MQVSVLSSGSRANVTLIESQGRYLLIDCGLSAREVENRLALRCVEPSQIEGVLITHEHSDHIKGLSVFSRRWKVPVYVNERTSAELAPVHSTEHFEPGSIFPVGPFEVYAFSVSHDAVDPVAFVIKAEGLQFAQCTDLGRVTPGVVDALRRSHMVVLESNHDQELLRSCHYPWPLKQRIASTQGHLSNDAAGSLLSELVHSDLRHVVLGHLSENSNTPGHALETVRRYLQEAPDFSLSCAGVRAPTPWFSVP